MRSNEPEPHRHVAHLARIRSAAPLARASVLLVLLVVAATACRTTGYVPIDDPLDPATGQPGSRLFEVAGRLGLTVVERGETYAALEDGRNTVLVFAGPGGRTYVNGIGVGPEGRVSRSDSDFLVPEAVEAAVREALRHAPPSPERAAPPSAVRRVIVVDAGHGGKDPGATSVFDAEEKHVNLDVALAVARILRDRGQDARLTRSGDVFVELEERAAFANRVRADLFVSLHSDSAENPSARGFTVYVRRSASDGSGAAARSIETSLVEAGIESRGVREAGYRVLVRTRCPAVLVEMGFLSHYGEAALLRSREYRDLLASRIAGGILGWLREASARP